MPRLRQRGFSLLELLVAVAVLGVLASVSFRGLSSVLDTEAHVRAEARRWNDIGLLMAQLREDLSAAVERPALRMTNSPADAQGQLVMARLGDGGVPSPLRRVGYRLRDGTVEYLVWPAADSPRGAVPAAHAVLENVTELRLRALREDGSWSAVWPVEGQASALPRAVAAEIVLAGGEHITRLFPLR